MIKFAVVEPNLRLGSIKSGVDLLAVSRNSFVVCGIVHILTYHSGIRIHILSTMGLKLRIRPRLPRRNCCRLQISTLPKVVKSNLFAQAQLAFGWWIRATYTYFLQDLLPTGMFSSTPPQMEATASHLTAGTNSSKSSSNNTKHLDTKAPFRTRRNTSFILIISMTKLTR